ncbi:MAG: MutS-related protein, partial [Gemmatimonadales bacterium]
NVLVREAGDRVVFLHRLAPGGTDRSYGVHVAELAGLPNAVVKRAREVLLRLEGEHRVVPGAPAPPPDPGQLALFADPLPHPVVDDLKAMDLNAMTPIEALNRLVELQRKAAGSGR